MKIAYDRWTDALDRGTSPEKTTILEKWLKKLRAGEVKPKVPCTQETCIPLHQKK